MSLHIDAAPPARPQIKAPVDGALLDRREIVVVGYAEPGTLVTVYDAAENALGSCTAWPVGDEQPTNWEVRFEVGADGPFTFRARTVDAAGNPSEWTDPVAVTVDTQPPTIEALTVTPPFVRLGTVLDLAVHALDAVGVERVFATWLRPQGGYVTPEDPDGDDWWTVSYPVELGGDGVQSIEITAVDGAHHEVTATTEVTLDNTPPTASLFEIHESSPYAHADGATVYYGDDGGGTFEVRISADDATSGLERAEFPATVSGGGVYDTALGGAYQYAHPYDFTGAVTQGSYDVWVYDRAGNLASATFHVTRDAAAPSASVTAVVQNDDVRVTWTASEDGANDSGLAACTLEVSEDGAAWQPLSDDCAGSITDSNVQAGRTYEFRLDAADQVGNSVQATDSLVYQGVVPQVSLSASADGTTIALTWSASDPSTGSGQVGSGLATCALEVQAAGSATWTPVSADCSGTALPYEGQPRTSYTFRLTATVPLR